MNAHEESTQKDRAQKVIRLQDFHSEYHRLQSLTARAKARDHAELRDARRRAAQAEIERGLLSAGVGERFAGVRFETLKPQSPEQAELADSCSRWAQAFADARKHGSNLVIWGAVGVGKTHLVAATLERVLSAGFTVAYVPEYRLLEQFRRAYGAHADVSEQHAIKALTDPDLLAVDDVGSSIGNAETRRAQLFRVIDSRYEHRRPTIVISNLAPDALRSYLGDRSWDRLTDVASARLPVPQGPSLRQRNLA